MPVLQPRLRRRVLEIVAFDEARRIPSAPATASVTHFSAVRADAVVERDAICGSTAPAPSRCQRCGARRRRRRRSGPPARRARRGSRPRPLSRREAFEVARRSLRHLEIGAVLRDGEHLAEARLHRKHTADLVEAQPREGVGDERKTGRRVRFDSRRAAAATATAAAAPSEKRASGSVRDERRREAGGGGGREQTPCRRRASGSGSKTRGRSCRRARPSASSSR